MKRITILFEEDLKESVAGALHSLADYLDSNDVEEDKTFLTIKIEAEVDE
jgi:hypothetical protein